MHQEPDGTLDSRAIQTFVDLLASTHLSRPSELPGLLAEHARSMGLEDLVVYLVDYEQSLLVPVPVPGAPEPEVLRIEGSVGGRAFAFTDMHDVETDHPDQRAAPRPARPR